MKIAIMGSGISGLSSAWALRNTHDVTLFEAADRLGGHSNTVDINYDGTPLSVDTGFIVYNDLNYPNLKAMFAHLGVETQPADMSFAFSAGAGREWSSNGLKGVFAWRRNLARIEFLSMLADIVRFSVQARSDLHHRRPSLEAPLGEYLAGCRIGEAFRSSYLLPMGAAIWSTPEAKILQFPTKSFLHFFDNHRLLQLKRPRWRTVTGGSKNYVVKLAADLEGRIALKTPVLSVTSITNGVMVETPRGAERFDAIVMAAHSDQILNALANPSPEQRNMLSAVQYGANEAYLHHDESLMPRRRQAWGAWNYMKNAPGQPACVTYWMNPLQGLPDDKPVFVTLNPPVAPDPSKTFGRFNYDHPLFDQAALEAQRGFHAIQGQGGIWLAGAWMGYGFHEDGIASGLRVAQALGGEIPWPCSFERLEQIERNGQLESLLEAA